MIAGALEIICGVDAGVVNPLLLPAAQGEEKYAYIVITYDDVPGVFDILFVKGNRVSEYASFHHDIRAILGVQCLEKLLNACGRRCRVYLFSVSHEGFERFLRTFHFEPSLNVNIDRLTRKQVSGLLTDSGCRNGILEVDCAGHPFPQIELKRFHSEDELLREASRFRRGRLSLYDLELNSAIRQRMAMLQGDVPGSPMDIDEADPPRDVTPGEKGDAKVSPERPASEAAPPIEAGAIVSAGTEVPECVSLFKNVLEEFTRAAKELYGSRLDKKMKVHLCREFSCPAGFDPSVIQESNAARVLTVIEKVVKGGWSRKRKELRLRAREIVSTLYEKHHEVLQRHDLDERVHDCYEAVS